MSETHEQLNEEWRTAARDDARRCTNRCKNPPTPPSLTVEKARLHPTYRHYLTPGAQCEHEQGHEGPHRNGGLIWHDPPALFVGGKRIW